MMMYMIFISCDHTVVQMKFYDSLLCLVHPYSLLHMFASVPVFHPVILYLAMLKKQGVKNAEGQDAKVEARV